jgi:hypothetical protein
LLDLTLKPRNSRTLLHFGAGGNRRFDSISHIG